MELFREGGLLKRGVYWVRGLPENGALWKGGLSREGTYQRRGPIGEGNEGCKHLSFIHSTKLLTLQSLSSSALTIRGRK